MLQGCDVKMARKGNFELRDAYCEFRKGELWIANSTIPVYPQASHVTHEPIRTRKLLAKNQEMKRLMSKVREKGKRQYDKRQTIKKREIERDSERTRR